eukprot:gene5018-biopygen16133
MPVALLVFLAFISRRKDKRGRPDAGYTLDFTDRARTRAARIGRGRGLHVSGHLPCGSIASHSEGTAQHVSTSYSWLWSVGFAFACSRSSPANLTWRVLNRARKWAS